MKVTIDLPTVETSDELHAVLVDLLCCSALIDDSSFRDRCDVKSSLQLLICALRDHPSFFSSSVKKSQ